MAVVGYVRVSSRDQNIDRQMEKMRGMAVDKIFQDKQSGKDTHREGLRAMLEYVREGDRVIVTSLDRLARSLSDLLRLVELLKEKKVDLVSVQEQVDTSTPQGRLMLQMFGMIAEFERATIADRRDQGIEIARKNGKRFGRPRIVLPQNFDREVKNWKAGGQTAVETYKKLGMTKASFYKAVKAKG